MAGSAITTAEERPLPHTHPGRKQRADILECGSLFTLSFEGLPLLHAIVGPPTFLFPGKMCRASGAGDHHANRSQGLPFGSAQGRRPGLTCFAPTVLRRKGGHDVLQRTADAKGAYRAPTKGRTRSDGASRVTSHGSRVTHDEGNVLNCKLPTVNWGLSI